MSDGAQFALILTSTLAACLLIVAIMRGYQKYGKLPRGLRWAPVLGKWTGRGVSDVVLRLFYPEVWALRERERQRIRMQERDGMTPWWDDVTQSWRPGSVLEVKDRSGAVVAKRPADYLDYMSRFRFGGIK